MTTTVLPAACSASARSGTPPSAGYKVDISRGERIGRVSSEWFSRPDDERFLSLGALHAAVRTRAERATARTVETKTLRVEASRDDAERLALIVPGQDAPIAPTHWSYGQLCSLVAAPASYMRQLPAPLAGINLQHGLLSHRAELVKTLEADDGRIELRAVTGPDYGRIWDHELVEAVMVGDVQQLQSIEAGAAFRLLAERHGAAEIGEVRRQAEPWMRDATRMFATGRTAEAVAAYSAAGMVHAGETRDAARTALIDRWDVERQEAPTASRIILTHMNTEVAMLNQAARERLQAQGELGRDVTVQTERGERQFAENERMVCCLRTTAEFPHPRLLVARQPRCLCVAGGSSGACVLGPAGTRPPPAASRNRAGTGVVIDGQ